MGEKRLGREERDWNELNNVELNKRSYSNA